MTKWQKRHMELSAGLLRYYQQYFVEKLDVCYTEYPAQMLLDKIYEEKGRGGSCMGWAETRHWVDGREQDIR